MNLKRSLFLGLTLLLCANVSPLLWSQGGARGAKVTQFTAENGNVDRLDPQNGMVTVRIAQTRYALRFDPNDPTNGAVLKALKVGQKVQVTLDKGHQERNPAPRRLRPWERDPRRPRERYGRPSCAPTSNPSKVISSLGGLGNTIGVR